MNYAQPDVLVSTDWVLANLENPDIKILDVNEDILLYHTGHIPGAQKIDWQGDLWEPVTREFIQPEALAKLFERLGITNDTTIVLYGDKNNWWASYAFWFFTYSGHSKLKLMNGGRIKWIEEQKPLSEDTPQYPASSYTAGQRNPDLRAFKDDVLAHLSSVLEGKGGLVDVRSLAEYTGERTHMPEYPQEGVLRGGHIPGAQSIPWATTVNPDGTFKTAEELTALYAPKGITPDKNIIAYCRIAERSSHTWFVLKYLLGFENVKNYDGSWTEWGNSVGVPIVKGEE